MVCRSLLIRGRYKSDSPPGPGCEDDVIGEPGQSRECCTVQTNESELHYQAIRSIVTLSSLNSPLYILDEGFFLREITAAEQTNYNRVMD